jgi:hypothetical protein
MNNTLTPRNASPEDALDMIAKLAESERAEQVFVRHAFLYRKVESGNRPMSLP